MKNNNQKKLVSAQESLNEMLKRIEPYIPKAPKAEQKEPQQWRLVGSGELPPLNSVEVGLQKVT